MYLGEVNWGVGNFSLTAARRPGDSNFQQGWPSLADRVVTAAMLSCITIVWQVATGPHAMGQPQVPFKKGINLTSWFQAPGAHQIQFTKFTKTDLERIKSLGCDAIRLPINLHAMTSGAPNYFLDPLFLAFLDAVVGWSEELQLHLLLDNHTFDPATNTDPNIGNILVKVWGQMANRYKSRSGFIYYEILNEPHGIPDATWGSIQQSVINAIRSADTQHYIIVGPANWNSYNNLKNLPVYADNKLIYTFHFYDPFIFTHQGASWTDPSMVPLSGVPFPFRAEDMPPVPPSLKGSWLESAINSYSSQGTAAYVKSLIDIAINFRDQRNVPVFCGEFGVYIPNSSDSDRILWYETVRQYFQQAGIPWTIWDYQGGFGLFEKGSNELFDYDLNVPLLYALGLNVPAQLEYVKRPKTTGLLIYDEFIGEGINDNSFPGSGTLDYYNDAQPMVGSHCVYWSGVAQYSSIVFDFKPDVDLSLLASHDHALEFWVKGTSPSVRFDVRFVDTKVSVADRPWRMGKTIDPSMGAWDGSWHKITLPLKDLEEKGAFDNVWYPPEGKFSWRDVDRMEIVAEHQSHTGVSFWFDDIRVSGEDVPEDEITAVDKEPPAPSLSIYPNPGAGQTNITFSIPQQDHVNVSVRDLAGKHIVTLADQPFEKGSHSIPLDLGPTGQPAGLYLVVLKTSDKVIVGKFIMHER